MLACLLMSAGTVVLAQPTVTAPAAGTSTATTEGTPDPKVDLWGDLVQGWKKLLESAGAMISATVVFLGLVTSLVQAWGKLRKEREFFAGGILKSNPNALSDKRDGIDYQIVLLGDGNAGKTTLLRMLSQNPKADTRAATGDIQTFGFSLTSYEPGSWECVRFLVDDYRGQSPGEIAAAPSLVGVTSEKPRAGAALFILDISPTEAGTGVMRPGTKFNAGGTYSPKRLQEHVTKWNSDGLSHVQAHLRGRVKFNYACCFINKMDLAQQWTVAEEQEIGDKLEKLFEEIKSHPLFSRDCRFEVVFGTLAVNENLDGPMRRDRLSVGCNLPLLWSRLVERARMSARK
jgi:hypothetical protein